MKHKLLFTLTLAATQLSPALRAVEGGSAHDAPGAVASVVDLLPGRESFAYVNLLHLLQGDYVWGKAGFAF